MKQASPPNESHRPGEVRGLATLMDLLKLEKSTWMSPGAMWAIRSWAVGGSEHLPGRFENACIVCKADCDPKPNAYTISPKP